MFQPKMKALVTNFRQKQKAFVSIFLLYQSKDNKVQIANFRKKTLKVKHSQKQKVQSHKIVETKNKPLEYQLLYIQSY